MSEADHTHDSGEFPRRVDPVETGGEYRCAECHAAIFYPHDPGCSKRRLTMDAVLEHDTPGGQEQLAVGVQTVAAIQREGDALVARGGPSLRVALTERETLVDRANCADVEGAKQTNPKDAVGTGKVPFSTVPAPVIAEIGLGMLEGARKYGRHNYRIAGIRASVYYDAAMRHLTDWWEGQDIDPASGLSHIVKALSTLVVLRDAMNNGKFHDDRPPAARNTKWMDELNDKAKEIIARYPDGKAPFTIDDTPWPR